MQPGATLDNVCTGDNLRHNSMKAIVRPTRLMIIILYLLIMWFRIYDYLQSYAKTNVRIGFLMQCCSDARLGYIELPFTTRRF